MKIRNFKLGITLLLSGLVLTGCASTNIEDSIERDMLELGSDRAESSVNEDMAEKMEYVSVSSGKKFSIPVNKSGYVDANAYSITAKTVDKNAVLDMVNRVFDPNTMQVQKPYEICSEKEINEIKDALTAKEKEAEDSSAVILDSVFSFDLQYMENQEEGASFSTDNVLASSVRAESTIGDDGDFTTEPQNIRTGRFTGLVDGEPFEIRFKEKEGRNRFKLFSMEPHYPLSEVYSSENETVPGFEENLCAKEDALKVAEDFIQKLGFEDYKLDTYAVRSVRKDSKSILDGYTFYYLPAVNDVLIGVSGNRTYEYYDEETVTEMPAQYLEISIDHQGVVSAVFTLQYEEMEPVSTDISLFPGDKTLDAIRKNLDLFQSLTDQDLAVTRIEFGYLPVRYPSGQNYVPAWIVKQPSSISYVSNVFMFDSMLFGVNALDGSIIESGLADFGMDGHSFVIMESGADVTSAETTE